MSAVEGLTRLYDVRPNLADGDRKFLRAVASADAGDAALEMIAKRCKLRAQALGQGEARPKPGRGKGAEANEQLKALLARAPKPAAARPAWPPEGAAPAPPTKAICASVDDLAPLAFACVEAAQRTKKGSALDDVLALQSLLARLAPRGNQTIQPYVQRRTV